MSLPAPSLQQGIKNLQLALENIPQKPGIYRMVSHDGHVLYVGKARNLQKRLTSYTKTQQLSYRLQTMVSRISKVEIMEVEKESEALLLEANLIKKLKPKYNIILKDDKTYPHILITKNHDFPRICKHRGKQKEQGWYFGPYPSASSVNRAIADLQKAFLIRPCTDNFFKNRKKPCMEYQIKRCSAPCVNFISKEEYTNNIKEILAFLRGKTISIQQHLQNKMLMLSKTLKYEEAAKIRDRIIALSKIQARQSINIANMNNADVFAFARNNNLCSLQVIFVRAGQNFGNKNLLLKKTEESNESQILQAALLQFYQKNTPPTQIIVANAIKNKKHVEEALTNIAGYKITIIIPTKGEKKKLIDIAIKNANTALQEKISQSLKTVELLEKIAAIFDTKTPLKRIEVYDNSHISGTNRVGAMIVATKEGLVKNAYRKFTIKSDINKGDDYAMMQEVLRRRLKNIGKNINEKDALAPELILIDGGKGQLSCALAVANELQLGQDITFAAIAKGPQRNAGEERFYVSGKQPFTLAKNDPVLHYLQRLRDEAHRFAISYHRDKRKKATIRSKLDDIPGIGKVRKKALIIHFGSIANIMEASIEELQKTPGINKAFAAKIYDFFH